MHIPRTVVIIIIIILVVVLPLLYCWYVLFSHLLDTWPPHCFHNTAFHFVLLDPIVMLGICHPIVFYFYVLVFVTALLLNRSNHLSILPVPGPLCSGLLICLGLDVQERDY